MNASVTAALLAAQHSAATDPVARLTKAGAVRSDKAIAIDPATASERQQIEDAIGLGLIQRRADGQLFINPKAVEERNARIGAQFLLVTMIGLSILASAAALFAFAAR